MELYNLDEIVDISEGDLDELARFFKISSESDPELMSMLVRFSDEWVEPEDRDLVRHPKFVPLWESPPDFGRSINRKLTRGDRVRIAIMLSPIKLLPPEPSKTPVSMPKSAPKEPSKIPVSSKIPPIPLQYPVIGELSREEIATKRGQVAKDSLIKPMFTQITGADLQRLFKAYNRIFFNDSLAPVETQVSTKMSRTAGSCDPGRRVIKIAQFFEGMFGTPGMKIQTAGWECRTRLECLQLTFEHELIHLIVGCGTGPIYSSHGKYFKDLVYAYFGQKGTKHNLFTQMGEDEEEYIPEVGDRVTFSNKGETYIGRVRKVNPKTVSFQADNGIFYKVSKGLLKPIEDEDEDDGKEPEPVETFKEGDYVRYKDRVGRIAAINPESFLVWTGTDLFSIGKEVVKKEPVPKTPIVLYTNRDFRVGQRVLVDGKEATILQKNPRRAVLTTPTSQIQAYYPTLKPLN